MSILNYSSPLFCQARDDLKELLWTVHFAPVLQHLCEVCTQPETSDSKEPSNVLPYTQTAFKNLLDVLDKTKARTNVDSQLQDCDPLKFAPQFTALTSTIQHLLSDPSCREISISSEIYHLTTLLHADLHSIFRLRFEMACLRDILTKQRETFEMCMKEGKARIQKELQEAARLIVRTTDLEVGIEDGDFGGLPMDDLESV